MQAIMRLGVALVSGMLFAQAPVPDGAGRPAAKPAAKPAAPADKPRVSSVQFDAGGWPIGGDDTTPGAAAPAGETARPRGTGNGGDAKSTRPDGDSGAPPAVRPRPEPEAPPALASGTQLGSPLLDIYQAAQSPAAWKQIGGVVVWWRITVYGASGEEIGVREVTHTADTAFAERDRLEYADGRTCGRSGAQVFAERSGMPMPTLAEAAAQELMLFGLQLRTPWAFGDANAFLVTGKDVEERGGERLRKITVEQRMPAAMETIGPEFEPRPRDRYELLYEPSSGQLREFVHRFAASQQTRRVLFEDWREFDGVPMKLPARRVYVDESLRPTTALEILRIERRRTSERDFRML